MNDIYGLIFLAGIVSLAALIGKCTDLIYKSFKPAYYNKSFRRLLLMAIIVVIAIIIWSVAFFVQIR